MFNRTKMTLIEGIGDEVIQFFVLIAIVVIAFGAWWSTNISERPFMRTIVIVERRLRRHSSSETQAGLGGLRETSDIACETNELQTDDEKTSQPENDNSNQIEVNVVENLENKALKENQNGINNSEEPLEVNCHQEMEKEDNNSTDESVVVRNKRIAFFQNIEDPTENINEFSKKLMDESSVSTECEAHSSNEGNIRIRLKYLNDDLKLVEGKLYEQLGDFKRRHFSLELSGRKLVRLIFNGKVLQQDTKTLQNYGFFDNCVVHCLVHQPRTPPPSPNSNRSQHESQTQNENAQQWDLGNILLASLSFLLGLAWYGRYQYAQLYTATTTVALIGLTGMFTVSLIGMYMPDIDGIRTQ